ncbi:MAG: atypical dual specificity phosphatase [Candidatus Krumholzibacteriia bacterium]|jgi:atypical dual specificity phosphatase
MNRRSGAIVAFSLIIVLALFVYTNDKPAPEQALLATDTDLDGVPNFSWVVDGQLAAMACPGNERSLESDLLYLEAVEVDRLISLTAEPIAPDSLRAHNMTGRHLPVEDFTPPTLDQITAFIAEVALAKNENYTLGIHCTAGLGRTGTMLAALFVSEGLSAEEAIIKVRKIRPGSVETPEQEARIAEFAEHNR